MTKQRATAVSWPNKPMPQNTKTLELAGSYSREEFVQISMGLIPKTKADKWFIYLDGEWLLFHRSQTGTCVFMLQMVPAEEGYEARTAVINQDPAQYRSSSDEYDVELISYLVDHLLLGKFVPFPTPRHLAKGDHDRHQQHVMGEKPGGSLRLNVLNNGRH
ncbi:MAG: hypothetical protein AAF614_20205 [Chloroflexota bacterium]